MSEGPQGGGLNLKMQSHTVNILWKTEGKARKIN